MELIEKLRKIEDKTKFIIHYDEDDIEDLEPMTYDYLINRNKGLPEEYFKPTNILYDPNEIAIHAITNEESGRKDVNEGLIRTYPTAKALQFVCTNLTNRGYPISPYFFLCE